VPQVPQVPVTATSDRPQAQTGKALPPAPPAAPATPGDQIASTVRWAQSQSASGWLVQHGIDNDVGRLLELRRSFPRLDESRVLALVRADGRLYYALVSGPFESADGARNFIRDGADIPSLPWVRSIASLVRELDERRGRVAGATAVN
jgi:septal ring-binding cell division protein DamX